ncbi:Uncharacterised protein [Pseudomonas aeruginosa]|nr:Uncharacterised protein [Pseudomonas aeruginosa]
MVPEVTTFDPGDVALGALDHHHGGDLRAILQRLFHILFQRNVLAAAHALVGGDHGAAVGIEDAVAQRVRRKAAEHHRVHRADAGAGEHGVGGLGNHRHVDADPVALLHPAALQHVGQAADVVVQLAVGDMRGFAGIVAFPDDGDLLAAALQMAVDAVVGDVQLAALEPAGLALSQIAMVDAVPGLEPVEEGLGLLAPEFLGIFHGLAVQAPVVVIVQVGTLADGLRHRVDADLEHGGFLCFSAPQGVEATARGPSPGSTKGGPGECHVQVAKGRAGRAPVPTKKPSAGPGFRERVDQPRWRPRKKSIRPWVEASSAGFSSLPTSRE